MGEIIGGAIVMILFIAFVMWKNRNKATGDNTFKRMEEERYWAEKNDREPEITDSGSHDGSD